MIDKPINPAAANPAPTVPPTNRAKIGVNAILAVV
jgi:hypothetical protein